MILSNNILTFSIIFKFHFWITTKTISFRGEKQSIFSRYIFHQPNSRQNSWLYCAISSTHFVFFFFVNCTVKVHQHWHTHTYTFAHANDSTHTANAIQVHSKQIRCTQYFLFVSQSRCWYYIFVLVCRVFFSQFCGFGLHIHHFSCHKRTHTSFQQKCLFSKL